MQINKRLWMPVVLTTMMVLGLGRQAYGQGCVAARQGGPMVGSMCAGEHGTAGSPASPGRWEVSFGYRWLNSFRHFVGDVEQPQRLLQNTSRKTANTCSTSR